MQHRLPIFILIITLLITSGCKHLIDSDAYRDKVIDYTKALIAEEYDHCMDLMATNHEAYGEIDIDLMEKKLPEIRDALVSNFGEELKFTSTYVERTIYGENENGLLPNTTGVLVQFENEKEFGNLTIVFDDKTDKIISWTMDNVKENIPNMLPFWLFGLLAICIPIFNLYVIARIRKSSLKQKWLKYLTVIVANIPAVHYSPIGEFGIDLLNFQITLGLSFSFIGYMYSSWTFGIPLGGIYWLRKLNKSQVVSNAANITSDTL